MATDADALRLQHIRHRHTEASHDWAIGRDGTELYARLLRGTAPVLVVRLAEDGGWQDRDFLAHAHADIAFLLRLLGRAFAEIRRLKPAEDPRAGELQQESAKRGDTDYARNCAMKCADQAFRRFLIEEKEMPDTADDDRVAKHVRFLLKVDSRSEINRDANARKRWLDLRAEFEVWMKEPV